MHVLVATWYFETILKIKANKCKYIWMRIYRHLPPPNDKVLKHPEYVKWKSLNVRDVMYGVILYCIAKYSLMFWNELSE